MENRLLLELLIERCVKTSIKTSLRNHCYISDVNWVFVVMYIHNKMTEMLLKKEDTKQEIENIMSEVYRKDMKLSVNYMKKEDFFERFYFDSIWCNENFNF